MATNLQKLSSQIRRLSPFARSLIVRTSATSAPVSAAPSPSLGSKKVSDRIVKLSAIDADGYKKEIIGLSGQTLLRALTHTGLIDPASHRLEDIEACSAECEVQIAEEWLEKLPPRTYDEEYVLKRNSRSRVLNKHSRLGCQVVLTQELQGMVVAVPEAKPWDIPMDQAELCRIFQMFDRNGDGKITKQELNDSLENLGIYIPDKDLVQMIEKIDLNGDGYVDIEEFGGLYQTIMEERDEEEDMREAFNVFDQNRDGFITVEELRSVLASLGLKQGRTLEDCKRMISKVDVDGDGMVNFKEFKQMMKGGGFAALGSNL